MDYSELLSAIQNQQCALVLGPNASLMADQQTTFAQEVANKVQLSRQRIAKYYEKDDLYHIPSSVDRTRICVIMQNRANEITASPPGFHTGMWDQLIELPFHLVLSLSPDKFLYHQMKQRGLDPQFSSFLMNPNDSTPGFEPPSVQRPLIFNLFGEINKAESLVLTQEDFYRYLNEVFTNPQKLQGLRTCLEPVTHLLFLGFPLDRWYVKLLMLLFDINSDSRFVALATHPRRDDLQHTDALKPDDPEVLELEDFCGKHFKIAFAPDNFLAFAATLRQKAEAAAAKNPPTIALRAQVAAAAAMPQARPDEPQQVAISYATDAKSVDIAQRLTQRLTAQGYEVLNEKVSLGYKGNISEFIQQMGAGQAVVTIISDNYLKNEKCMNIALTLEENQNLEARIFPIVLEDARIYTALERVNYLRHWDTAIEQLNTALRDLNDLSYTRSIQEQLNLYSEIRRFADGFTDIIGNMNCLTPDIHLNENFDTLFAAVEARFQQDIQNPAP